MSTEIILNKERLKVWFRNSLEDVAIEGTHTKRISLNKGNDFSVFLQITCVKCDLSAWLTTSIRNGVDQSEDVYPILCTGRCTPECSKTDDKTSEEEN